MEFTLKQQTFMSVSRTFKQVTVDSFVSIIGAVSTNWDGEVAGQVMGL